MTCVIIGNKYVKHRLGTAYGATTLDSVATGINACGTFTVNLPATPSTNQIITINNTCTGVITVSGNGNNIGTVASTTLAAGISGTFDWDGVTWAAVFSNNTAIPHYYSAPTIGTATAGDTTATVAFTPPYWDGILTITSYTATSSPGNITASGVSSPILVTGLTNGVSYTFTVHANGGFGASEESASSNPVIPTSAVTYATLNPSDKSTNITLSGGNLIANIGTAVGVVRSTIAKSTGKWYWEFYMTSIDHLLNTTGVGIANINAGLDISLGVDINGWSYGNSEPDGVKVHNGIGEIYGLPFIQGDVIGVALDMDAGTLQFYLNGSSQGIAYSGLSGSIYAAIGFYATAQAETITANFGASAFSYSVPIGYNAGLYA